MTPEKRKPTSKLTKRPPLPVEPHVDIREVDPDFEAYFTLPTEDRSMFLRGLMVASNNAPTKLEWLLEELESNDLTLTNGGEKFDKHYGVLADSYAKSIDRSYHPDGTKKNPETVRKRDMFYSMIRFHPAEEITASVKGILDRPYDTR
ncbi:MAG: hypothetical protein A2857_01740 [Candidatus Levybacteria bacterium RIFCSPHIGHO2_01_FULL_36_15]|nr:MAG: hypothetical protein A2857_01740 [Candidatus Levybacteria bacterium RIFCSPHIGHO2_01_FULL_36_15]OGH38007.1 MAG: hypothetical protein A2905_05850 [Candidatus Levybacteria bacterium RIFCSPLOWO2_01_FULL_36_10]